MTQTETRIFHYDLRGHLIAETNQTGQTIAEYIYLGGQLLSTIKPGESVYYYHNDHLGTPQVLTDDTQTIAWKAVYTPFGEAVASVQTVDNPFRFPGQYYDQETGLHYNYFRYYNPQTGRYITPDPIGLEGGVNLFVYVDNNPLNWVDSFGLYRDYSKKGGPGDVDNETIKKAKETLEKGGDKAREQARKILEDEINRLTKLLKDSCGKARTKILNNLAALRAFLKTGFRPFFIIIIIDPKTGMPIGMPGQPPEPEMI